MAAFRRIRTCAIIFYSRFAASTTPSSNATSEHCHAFIVLLEDIGHLPNSSHVIGVYCSSLIVYTDHPLPLLISCVYSGLPTKNLHNFSFRSIFGRGSSNSPESLRSWNIVQKRESMASITFAGLEAIYAFNRKGLGSSSR